MCQTVGANANEFLNIWLDFDLADILHFYCEICIFQLEGISDKDICTLDLPNGIPIVYRFSIVS